MKEEWYDKTERYIRGELSDAERQAFEKELSSNSELQAFYESQKNIIAGIFHAAEKKMPGDYLIEEQVRRVDWKVRERERRRILFKVGGATLLLGLIIGLAGGYWWWGEEAFEEETPLENDSGELDPLIFAEPGVGIITLDIPIRSVSVNNDINKASLILELHEYNGGAPRYWHGEEVLKVYRGDTQLLNPSEFELILSGKYGPILRYEDQYFEVPYQDEDKPLNKITEDSIIRDLRVNN